MNIRTILAACALAATPAGAMDIQGWTLIDLGTLGGAGSYGAAVSNSGLVVGCADTGAGSAHAFLYHNGAMRDLGTASGDSSGSSCALAVNNAGLVAGRSSTGELVTWNEGFVAHLGVNGNIGGVNDDGVVAGAYSQGSSTHAFVYANGALMPIAGDSSAAAAINATGTVVGVSNGRAFAYQGGGLRDLGTLGGTHSDAKGVNGRGEIVGMSTDANAQPLSFSYDTAMHALSAPSYSGAVAINDRNQVVGSGEGIYGYLIDGAAFTRLDTLAPVVARGWRHLEPTGINDRGWIVGTGTDPSGNLRAFLLIPGGTPAQMTLADMPRGHVHGRL